MIKNQRQYDTTQVQAARFEAALESFEADRVNSSVHPRLLQAEREGMESVLAELRAELREYDALRTGKRRVLELTSLSEVPAALIQARIAAGLNQRDLADRLGWKVQQLQRYEATDYAGASLARIQQVADALEVGFREEVLLPGTLSLSAVAKTSGRIGVQADFLKRRFATGGRHGGGVAAALSAVSNLSRVYRISTAELYGDAPPRFDLAAASGGRFKVRSGANPERLTAYTVYAHYLSLLAQQATDRGPQKPIPKSAADVRSAILERHGKVEFSSVLAYVWDLGIPVLPLSDPGAFHGACFRDGGRNVIVLKQRSSSLDRWTFDLLHELRHAAEAPELEQRDVIEIDKAPQETKSSPEESTCNRFAGDVVLSGRAEELTQEAVRRAGTIPGLKSVVADLARLEGVPTGALANYIAVRLDASGKDWWGAANNLQESGNPWLVARDKFLTEVDASVLSPPDRDLLMQALTDFDATETNSDV